MTRDNFVTARDEVRLPAHLAQVVDDSQRIDATARAASAHAAATARAAAAQTAASTSSAAGGSASSLILRLPSQTSTPLLSPTLSARSVASTRAAVDVSQFASFFPQMPQFDFDTVLQRLYNQAEDEDEEDSTTQVCLFLCVHCVSVCFKLTSLSYLW